MFHCTNAWSLPTLASNQTFFLKRQLLKELEICKNKFVTVIIITTRYYVTLAIFFLSPGSTQPIVGVYFTALYRGLASSRKRLLDHKQRRATVGRTPLNELSVRRRDLYLTTHNTHNRKTSMPLVGFEPTIAAGERP